MRIKVIGLSTVDFVNKDGASIKGTSIYACFRDERVTGMKAEKFFVSQTISLPPIKPGDEIDMSFTHQGRIERVEAVSTAK